jgi:hypothetical protein
MSNADAVGQDSNIQIPRRGEVMAITVDTTGRAIDLRLLAFNDVNWKLGSKEWVFVNLKNQDAANSIFFYAAPDNTVTIDPAAIIAAGTAASFPGTHAWFLAPGEERSYRISRDNDLFLHVRATAGTPTLRLGTSSDNTVRLY